MWSLVILVIAAFVTGSITTGTKEEFGCRFNDDTDHPYVTDSAASVFHVTYGKKPDPFNFTSSTDFKNRIKEIKSIYSKLIKEEVFDDITYFTKFYDAKKKDNYQSLEQFYRSYIPRIGKHMNCVSFSIKLLQKVSEKFSDMAKHSYLVAATAEDCLNCSNKLVEDVMKSIAGKPTTVPLSDSFTFNHVAAAISFTVDGRTGTILLDTTSSVFEPAVVWQVDIDTSRADNPSTLSDIDLMFKIITALNTNIDVLKNRIDRIEEFLNIKDDPETISETDPDDSDVIYSVNTVKKDHVHNASEENLQQETIPQDSTTVGNAQGTRHEENPEERTQQGTRHEENPEERTQSSIHVDKPNPSKDSKSRSFKKLKYLPEKILTTLANLMKNQYRSSVPKLDEKPYQSMFHSVGKDYIFGRTKAYNILYYIGLPYCSFVISTTKRHLLLNPKRVVARRDEAGQPVAFVHFNMTDTPDALELRMFSKKDYTAMTIMYEAESKMNVTEKNHYNDVIRMLKYNGIEKIIEKAQRIASDLTFIKAYKNMTVDFMKAKCHERHHP